MTIGKLYLINADTDLRIRQLNVVDTVNLHEFPTRNLSVEYVPDVTNVGRVALYVDGKLASAEGAAPYAFGGDDKGNFRPWPALSITGTKTLGAVVFSDYAMTHKVETATPISLTVVDIVPAPPPIAMNCVAGDVLHLRADASQATDDTRFRWSIGDPNGKYNELQGFNIAHDFSTPGVYPIAMIATRPDGTTFAQNWAVSVVPSLPKVTFSNEAEWRAVTAKGNVIAVATADITVNSTSIIPGFNTIIDFAGHKLIENSTSSHSTIDGVKGRVSIRNVVYDNPAKNARLIRLYNDSFAINVTILHAGEGFNLNNQPNRVLIQDVTVVDDHAVRGATVWVQGSDVVLLNVKSPNSLEAQTVRSGGTDWFSVGYCDLGNTDADGSGPDFARQSLAVHPGQYVSVFNNHLWGGRVEFGPLGGTDGYKPGLIDGRLRHVQVLDNTIELAISEIQFCHRTMGALFDGNHVTVPNAMGMKIEDAADVLAAADKTHTLPYYGPDAICADINVTANNFWKRTGHPGELPTIYVGAGSQNIKVATQQKAA